MYLQLDDLLQAFAFDLPSTAELMGSLAAPAAAAEPQPVQLRGL